MLLSNANQQPEVTGLTGVNLIGLDAGDAWCQVPASLLGTAVRRVSHKTTSYSIQAAECGTLFTNLGATATLTFTLPPATVGLHFQFQVRASAGTSWQLRVVASGSELLESCAATRATATTNDYLWADAIGENLHLVCLEAGKWAVLTYEGTWTLVAV
jgi:hypothetical protein